MTTRNANRFGPLIYTFGCIFYEENYGGGSISCNWLFLLCVIKNADYKYNVYDYSF